MINNLLRFTIWILFNITETKQIIPDRVTMTKNSFEPIFKDGSLVIGQDQDNLGRYGGGFDARQAFSGELAQLEIWNKELSISDIEKIANCKIMSVMESYRVVSWFSEKWETNNVELKDITMENLCMVNPSDFSFGYWHFTQLQSGTLRKYFGKENIYTW